MPTSRKASTPSKRTPIQRTPIHHKEMTMKLTNTQALILNTAIQSSGGQLS